jgi:hypothetical protein
LQISIGDIHDELNNTWFRPMELLKVGQQQSQSQRSITPLPS